MPKSSLDRYNPKLKSFFRDSPSGQPVKLGLILKPLPLSFKEQGFPVPVKVYRDKQYIDSFNYYPVKNYQIIWISDDTRQFNPIGLTALYTIVVKQTSFTYTIPTGPNAPHA